MAFFVKRRVDENKLLAYKLSPILQQQHIEDTKRDQTKLSRMEKIKPLILQKIGLNDKYNLKKPRENGAFLSCTAYQYLLLLLFTPIKSIGKSLTLSCRIIYYIY
jgi:hypothetical protein